METGTKRVEAGVDGLARFIAHHWLLLTNVAVLAFILPTLLAPCLASVGAYWPSRVIYFLYRLTCHQLPERSFFLFSHKMAICARCTAFYTSFWGMGLLQRLEGHAMGMSPPPGATPHQVADRPDRAHVH